MINGRNIFGEENKKYLMQEREREKLGEVPFKKNFFSSKIVRRVWRGGGKLSQTRIRRKIFVRDNRWSLKKKDQGERREEGS